MIAEATDRCTVAKPGDLVRSVVSARCFVVSDRFLFDVDGRPGPNSSRLLLASHPRLVISSTQDSSSLQFGARIVAIEIVTSDAMLDHV